MSNYIIDVRVSDKGTKISSGAGEAGGASGLMGGAMGLGALVGLTTVLVNIAKDMLWSFKPVMTVLKGIAKTLGMFLEPIAQVLLLLFRPLMDFIRPMALMFRAMMAPVMDLMRGYSAVMSSQLASGDTSGAMTTGLDMITLALGGVFIALGDVVGDLLFTNLENVFIFMSDTFIDMSVNLLKPAFSIIDKIFKTDLVGGLMAGADMLKTGASEKISSAFDSTKDALHDGTEKMMDMLVSTYSDKLEDLKETTNINLIHDTIVPLDDTIANTALSISTETSNLKTSTNSSLTNMSWNVSTMMGTIGTGSIPSKFKSGLDDMNDSIDDFVSSAESAGSRIRSALREAEQAKSRYEIRLGSFYASID